jgi:hypothetical protein
LTPFLEQVTVELGREKVPVDCNVLVALVVDVDEDDVAVPREDCRAGELAVDGEDGLLAAEPSVVSLPYLRATDSVLSSISIYHISGNVTKPLHMETYEEIVVTANPAAAAGSLSRGSCRDAKL